MNIARQLEDIQALTDEVRAVLGKAADLHSENFHLRRTLVQAILSHGGRLRIDADKAEEASTKANSPTFYHDGHLTL